MCVCVYSVGVSVRVCGVCVCVVCVVSVCVVCVVCVCVVCGVCVCVCVCVVTYVQQTKL